MKRTAVAFSLLAAVGGCVSMESAGGGPGPVINGPNAVMPGPSSVPYAMGPGGVPVPARGGMASASATPSGEEAARMAFAQRMPPEIVQQVALNKAASDNGLLRTAGAEMGPPGMGGPGMMPGGMPPGGGMMPPGGGMMPPGGGMMPPGGGMMPPGGGYPPGAVAAVGALTGAYAGQFAAARTSVRFIEPRGMKVSWMIPSPDGRRLWNDKPLESPATYNFAQAAIYRLKLSDIPDYPGVDLYPTLEVVPANQRAMTFLAHSSVPVGFTADDFRMVNAGNYVVKVIYLPDPQYQDIAVGGGLGELISTQLEPGVDPIVEASKRGSILLIARLGNIDLELRHSPAMDAPPACPVVPPGVPGMPPGGMGMMPPGMRPPGMMPPTGPGMPGNSGPAPRTAPTTVPGAAFGRGSGELPPLPPQTNPLTPAQLAGQQMQ
jgi:hypothetical protein